ncbi:hypothetical protein A3Q56_06726, partial [Intoshia linei]
INIHFECKNEYIITCTLKIKFNFGEKYECLLKESTFSIKYIKESLTFNVVFPKLTISVNNENYRFAYFDGIFRISSPNSNITAYINTNVMHSIESSKEKDTKNQTKVGEIYSISDDEPKKALYIIYSDYTCNSIQNSENITFINVINGEKVVFNKNSSKINCNLPKHLIVRNNRCSSESLIVNVSKGKYGDFKLNLYNSRAIETTPSNLMRSNSLNNINSFRFRHANVYPNSNRNVFYTPKTSNEWNSHISLQLIKSQKEKSDADLFKTASWKIVKSSEQKLLKIENENTKKLGDRINSISVWKNDLIIEIKKMDANIKLLEKSKESLIKLLEETRGPLSISIACIKQREKRCKSDRINDKVEKLLNQEVDIIMKYQLEISSFIKKITEQMKSNMLIKKTCEKDLERKLHAMKIENRLHCLTLQDKNLKFFPGVQNFDNFQSKNDNWEIHSKENISKSVKERQKCDTLKNGVENITQGYNKKMWTQYNYVNNAFFVKHQVTMKHLDSLNNQLNKTCKIIVEIKKAIFMLKNAIELKRKPLKLVETRLQERSKRIGIENCNDFVNR